MDYFIRKSHQLHQHVRWSTCNHVFSRYWWRSWWVLVVSDLIVFDIQIGGWWRHHKWWGQRCIYNRRYCWKTEFEMETSARLKVFCGKIWVTGKAWFILHKPVTDLVKEFGDRLWETSVYPKFDHLLDLLMRILYKSLMEKLIRDSVAYAHDTWWNMAVCTMRGWLIRLDDMTIDIAKF